MVGRHAAARQAVQEDGDLKLLAERAQGVLAVRPVEPGAGHHHGPLGVAQQLGRAVQRVAVGLGRPRRVRQRGGGVCVHRRLHEHLVHREVEEGGAGGRLERGVQGLVDERGDVGGGLGGSGQLGQRRDERDVVDLLERAHPPACGRGAAAEREHRRAVHQRGRHPAHPVRDARARRERAHARLPGGLGPALGRERRGLLVADVDDVDALLAAAVVDREQMTAGEREQLRDAVRLEALRHQAPAVEGGRLLSLGFGAHEGA